MQTQKGPDSTVDVSIMELDSVFTHEPLLVYHIVSELVLVERKALRGLVA